MTQHRKVIALVQAMIILAFIFLLMAWLTGCTEASWSAKLRSEPDWKEGPEFMPSAEVGMGGRF